MIAIEPHRSETWPAELAWIDVAVLHEKEQVADCYISFSGPDVLLYSVNTKEPYRRQGFGHELMQGVEIALLQNEIDVCRLYVFRDNEPAKRLYLAHGWRTVEAQDGDRFLTGDSLYTTMEWRREWIGSTAALFPTVLTCSPSMNASS